MPKIFVPTLSQGQQRMRMKALFPSFKFERGERGIGIWKGSLQPTVWGDKYRVQISYSPKSSPSVEVLSPKLRSRPDGERPPHLYSGERLCLYLPNSGEWTRQMFLADTIVPWTSLWLYYYEIWYVTGSWLGGGKHPVAKSEKKARRDTIRKEGRRKIDRGNGETPNHGG